MSHFSTLCTILVNNLCIYPQPRLTVPANHTCLTRRLQELTKQILLNHNITMTEQGYPSKRHRGGDQPHRKKRSHAQPHVTSTSTQTADPMIAQDYNVSSQPLNEAGFWEEYAVEPMDWEQGRSEKLGSISSYTSYLNADTPSGGVTNALGGYVMVPNQSSGAYSSGSGSHQTSEEASDQGQQAHYSPPWTPAAKFAVDTEGMRGDSLGVLVYKQQWRLPGLETESKTHSHC